MRQQFIILTLFFLLLESELFAKNRSIRLPQQTIAERQRQTDQGPKKQFGQQLDYVIVELNNERHLVKSGYSIDLVYGDIFRLSDVVLRMPSEKSPKLRWAPEAIDIADELIDTAKDMPDQRCAGGGQEAPLYTVEVMTGEDFHGMIQIRCLKPIFHYANFSVNGKLMTSREDLALQLKTDDKIKLDKVYSNMSESSDVAFEVIPIKTIQLKDKLFLFRDYYDILFSRKQRVFARVPLVVDRRE
ncbi:MAG: hypothetical protein KA436_03780 [Oligoflexales bacterium]|nr:hypothetical protein [Oligoflexales bacterium]